MCQLSYFSNHMESIDDIPEEQETRDNSQKGVSGCLTPCQSCLASVFLPMKDVLSFKYGADFEDFYYFRLQSPVFGVQHRFSKRSLLLT